MHTGTYAYNVYCRVDTHTHRLRDVRAALAMSEINAAQAIERSIVAETRFADGAITAANEFVLKER
jgi:hypothetical protein